MFILNTFVLTSHTFRRLVHIFANSYNIQSKQALNWMCWATPRPGAARPPCRAGPAGARPSARPLPPARTHQACVLNLCEGSQSTGAAVCITEREQKPPSERG